MPLNNEVSIVNFGGTDNDIKDSYARSLIADEETTTTATHPYSKGDYFIWTDRQLYKAKTDISVGDTLVLNTNVEEAGDVTDEISKINKAADATAITVTGNPLSFSTDEEQVAKNAVITFEPVQAGSGDPSPSNVRAISGYNSLDARAVKTNLWDKGNVSGTRGITINYILPIGTYTISALVTSSDTDSDNSCVRFNYYDGNTQNIYLSRNERASSTVTLTKKVISISFYASRDYTYSASDTFTYADIQLELGSTATAYEPYNPITDISIKLGETVYGGTVNLKTGEMTVNKIIEDMGNLNWISNYNAFIAQLSNYYFSGNADVVADIICECYKILSQTETADKDKFVCSITQYPSGVLCKDTTYNDVSAFKTAVTGKKIVYGLATPITYHLTPHQIRLLKGGNVVTTNGTSISLSYRKGEIAKLDDVSEVSAFAEEVNKHSFTYADNAKNGSKNHNSYPYYDSTKVVGSVTFTDIGDGRISIVCPGGGGGSQNFNCHLTNSNPLILKNGSYKLSGGSGVSDKCTVWMVWVDRNNQEQVIYCKGKEVTFNIDGSSTSPDYAPCRLTIGVDSASAQNIIVEPMVRDANDTDPTWAPWAMTNNELTEKALAKNITASTSRGSDITSDGTIIVVRSGNVVSVALLGIKFSSTGSNKSVLSGLPKCLAQSSGMFGGVDASKTAESLGAGNTFWIGTGQTTINAHIGNNSNVLWASCIYICE